QVTTARQPGLVRVGPGDSELRGELQPIFGQSGNEPLAPLVRGTEQRRPGNVSDAPMPELGEPPGSRRGAMRVTRQDQPCRHIDRGARDTDVGTISALEELGEALVLGNRRGQNDAEKPQALYK